MIAWALEIMLSMAMLMALVLAFRKPVAQLFGAEWAYALWLLPVIVPFLPHLPSLSSGPAFTLLLPPVETGAASVAAAPENAASSGEWLLLLLALWAGGGAFFAIWQQSTYSAFMLHLGPQGRAAVPPSYGGIKVVESDAVEGPVALGILNRRIVVPLDFGTRYNATEQRLALEHELIHHRRFDILWNWVALGMVTFNWFNPIAHFAFRAFRIDQELSCDAAVTRRSPAERHDYACALVKSASHPGVVAVCPLNRAEFLKRRLRMMKQHRASLTRTLGGLVSIALFGFLGLTFGTPGFAQSDRAASGQVVVSHAADPIITKTEIATLREKCGKDEAGNRDSIVCSDEEARDPEVRAIMDRTMKRLDAHVEKVTRRALANADAAVARATASIDAAAIARDADLAARIESSTRARMVRVPSSEQRQRIQDSLARVHDQLARLDIDRTVREALRSGRGDVRIIRRSSLSPEDRAEMEREIAEARREALRDAEEARRDAAEARREALQDAAEARREALEEAEEAKREALQEGERSRWEIAREMSKMARKLERQFRFAPPVPPVPPSPPVASVPPVPPVPAVAPVPPAPPAR